MCPLTPKTTRHPGAMDFSISFCHYYSPILEASIALDPSTSLHLFTKATTRNIRQIKKKKSRALIGLVAQNQLNSSSFVSPSETLQVRQLLPGTSQQPARFWPQVWGHQPARCLRCINNLQVATKRWQSPSRHTTRTGTSTATRATSSKIEVARFPPHHSTLHLHSSGQRFHSPSLPQAALGMRWGCSTEDQHQRSAPRSSERGQQGPCRLHTHLGSLHRLGVRWQLWYSTSGSPGDGSGAISRPAPGGTGQETEVLGISAVLASGFLRDKPTQAPFHSPPLERAGQICVFRGTKSTQRRAPCQVPSPRFKPDGRQHGLK